MSTSTTNPKRLWLGGGALAGVLVLVGSWFTVVSPELTAAAAAREAIEPAQLQNTLQEAKNARLKAQNEDVAALRSELTVALAQLPSDGGLPDFTRQLSAQATATSVQLTSVVVGAAAPVVASDLGAPVDAAVPAAGGEVATDTAAADAAAGPAEAAAGADLVQITVSASVNGLGRDLVAFLGAIQVEGPRRALVTSVQLSPGEGETGSGLDAPSTLNLTMVVFSAPLPPADLTALEELLSGA